MNFFVKRFWILLPFLPVMCYSQVDRPIDIAKVSSEIERNSVSTVSVYEKCFVQDSLLNLLRIHYAYLSNMPKYELAVVSTDKDKRILMYEKIRSFPFFTVHNPFYGHELSDLYRKATRNLIFEHRGNLEALNNLDIVPSQRADLYGFLRREIEFIGGTWDKGEIPTPDDMIEAIKKSRNKN